MPISNEESKFKELKDKLRRQLGNLSLTQLTDEQAGDAVTSGLKEFSKNKPMEVLDSIMTERDEETYDLSAKERIIKVKEVFYAANREFVLEEYWPEVALQGRLEGLSLFENPSLWTQYMQRLEQYERMFDGDFQYNQATKELMLIPAPTQAQRVYFVWTQRHMASTVPEGDEDTVLLWAKGQAKEMLAAKAANAIRSVSGYGESVTLGATPESLMKEAEDLRRRFERKFSGSTVIVG